MQEPTRKISAQHAQQVIHSIFAVIKMISSPISPNIDNRSWKLIIDGLNEPHKNRFVKPLNNNIDRSTQFNPQEKQWKKRAAHPTRGRNKKTAFTKKTALTLMPPRGNITLFAPRYGTPIGLLFDWRLCHRKHDRYVFTQNIVSDQKPWLARTNKPLHEQHPPEGISFAELQQSLRELSPDKIADQNELLGGLHRSAALAIFSPENTLFTRINALAKKNLVLQSAELDLPILIYDKKPGVFEYTVGMQNEDIAEILRNAYPPEIKSLAKSCANSHEPIYPVVPLAEPSAPPLELLLQNFPPIAPPPSPEVMPSFNQRIAKDIRRRILFYMDFFSLVLLRQQIPDHSEPALLRLKADIHFIIKQVGPFVLSQIRHIESKHVGLPYKKLLQLYLPALSESFSFALVSVKKLNIILHTLPHLVLSKSTQLEGTPKIYALEGKSEQGTWGEYELKYRDVGLHYRKNLLFSILEHSDQDILQKLSKLYPRWLTSTFETLQTIYSFVLKHAGSNKYKFKIDPKKISKKWKAFIKIAPRELTMETTFDPILKKPITNFVLDEIILTTQLKDIHGLYDRFGHSPWFATPKNPTWDNVCTLFHPKRSLGIPAYPDAQRDIILLLQRRAFEILTESRYSTADAQELLNSPLFNREHIRRGIPEETYSNLERLIPTLHLG